MRVEVGRQADLAVAKHLLDDADVHPVRQQQAGGRVA